jgi:hypothetical protein
MSIATRTENTFRIEYSVATHIAAPPERVWAVLTNLKEWVRWTATVTSIDGQVVIGSKLALRVPISDRTFTPKVASLEPNRRMVWSDGAAPMFTGTRTYALAPNADGTTDFSMVEVFRGVMLPLIKRSLPDFRPPFERFAADLKLEAEKSR